MNRHTSQPHRVPEHLTSEQSQGRGNLRRQSASAVRSLVVTSVIVPSLMMGCAPRETPMPKPVGPASEEAVQEVVTRLDGLLSERRLDDFFREFVPEHLDTFSTMVSHLRMAFNDNAAFRVHTVVKETRLIGSRRVALLHRSFEPINGPMKLEGPVEQHLFYAFAVDANGHAFPVLAVPTRTSKFIDLKTDEFACPTCSYGLRDTSGWLIAPQGRGLSASVDSVCFFYIGADLDLEIAVHEAKPESHAIDVLEEFARKPETSGTDSADVHAVSWWPPTMKRIKGASAARLEMPRNSDGPIVHMHLVVYGTMQYLMVLKGRPEEMAKPAVLEAAKSITSGFFIDERGRSVARVNHDLRTLRGGKGEIDAEGSYVSKKLNFAFTGPKDWVGGYGTDSVFELSYQAPHGADAQMRVTVQGPPIGMHQCPREVAENRLREVAGKVGVVPMAEPAWVEQGEFAVMHWESDVPAPDGDSHHRKILRAAVGYDLCVLMQGHASDEAAADAIRDSFASLRRP